MLNDHPVAFWDLNSTTSTETDLTGNGHTGTYKGGQPAQNTMLNGDKVNDFNGSSEYLQVPSSPAFSISTTHELTWEAWIRPDVLQFPHMDSTNEYVDFMGKCQNYSPTCEWESRMYATTNSQSRPNRISAYVFNPSAGLGSAADWQPNTGMFQAGQWLHVVGEYQTSTTPSQCSTSYPGTINIWVNGVEQDFAAHEPTGCMSQHDIVPVANNSPLDIGTMALDSWFPGAVGKVAIYNYLLSQSQIDSHFTAMTGASVSGSCSSTCTVPVPTQTGTPPSTTTTMAPTTTTTATAPTTTTTSSTTTTTAPTTTTTTDPTTTTTAPATTTTTAPKSSLLSGIQAYWKFDQGSGTVAADATGNGHTGTVQGSSPWTTGGKIGDGLQLNGTSNDVSTSLQIPTSGPVTYSAWVKRSDTSNNYAIIGSTSTDHGGPLIRIMSGSNNIKFWRQTCCSGTEFSNVLPSAGTWALVTLEDNPSAGTTTLFVDGVKKGTNSYTSADSTDGDLEVGVYQTNSNYLHGDIDEVGVWNRILSSSEVSELWNGGSGLQYPF